MKGFVFGSWGLMRLVMNESVGGEGEDLRLFCCDVMVGIWNV